MTSTDMFDSFGDRLTIALKNAGYEPKEAGEKLGVSKNVMKNYINGGIPKTKILYQLSQLLEVSMEWLLTGEVEFTGKIIVKDKLTEEEEQLIYTYRKLSEKQKWLLEGYLNGITDAKKGMPESE